MPDPERVVVLTQTTLSVQETQAILERLRERFPKLELPPTEDICYATTNRQAAVAELSERGRLVLVVGSKTSSNSNRLVETARAQGPGGIPRPEPGGDRSGLAGGRQDGGAEQRRVGPGVPGRRRRSPGSASSAPSTSRSA